MGKETLSIKVYTPKKEKAIDKKQAIPLLFFLGDIFSRFNEFFSFFVSSFMLSIKTFWKTEKQIKEFRAKREKIIDLRV